MENEWGTIRYTDKQIANILRAHTLRLERGDLDLRSASVYANRIKELQAEQARRRSFDTIVSSSAGDWNPANVPHHRRKKIWYKPWTW